MHWLYFYLITKIKYGLELVFTANFRIICAYVEGPQILKDTKRDKLLHIMKYYFKILI